MMTPWQVRIDKGDHYTIVARVASADIAAAVVHFLWEREGIFAEVVRSEGPRFERKEV